MITPKRNRMLIKLTSNDPSLFSYCTVWCASACDICIALSDGCHCGGCADTGNSFHSH
jgi:hypothetical protein